MGHLRLRWGTRHSVSIRLTRRRLHYWRLLYRLLVYHCRLVTVLLELQRLKTRLRLRLHRLLRLRHFKVNLGRATGTISTLRHDKCPPSLLLRLRAIGFCAGGRRCVPFCQFIPTLSTVKVGIIPVSTFPAGAIIGSVVASDMLPPATAFAACYWLVFIEVPPVLVADLTSEFPVFALLFCILAAAFTFHLILLLVIRVGQASEFCFTLFRSPLPFLLSGFSNLSIFQLFLLSGFLSISNPVLALSQSFFTFILLGNTLLLLLYPSFLLVTDTLHSNFKVSSRFLLFELLLSFHFFHQNSR